jgi:WD40 repeat protein
MAYSPDGTRIVSGDWGSYDGRDGSRIKGVLLWNAATGQELLTLPGVKHSVISLTYSPDGTHILSGDSGGRLSVWNAATGQLTRTLTGHTGYVNSVAYSPDSTRIVSGSRDKTVKIWDAETGEELRTLTEHTADVTSVCVSPDGTRLVSASEDGIIRFWDTSFYQPEERTLRYFAAPNPTRHLELATQQETTGNLYAAVFHRAWVLKIQPENPERHDQFHAAYQKWLETPTATQETLPPVVREMLALPRKD